jgi:hypothetical protein
LDQQKSGNPGLVDHLFVTVGLEVASAGVEAVRVGVVVRLVEALAVALVDERVQVDLQRDVLDFLMFYLFFEEVKKKTTGFLPKSSNKMSNFKL